MEDNGMVTIDIHEDMDTIPAPAPTQVPPSSLSRICTTKYCCAAMTIAGIILWNIVSKI